MMSRWRQKFQTSVHLTIIHRVFHTDPYNTMHKVAQLRDVLKDL